MSGGIYLIHGDGRLVQMGEHDYDSEDLLQELLAQHPDLLAGEQMNNQRPLRWLLVSRERGVPSEDGGGNRWSVDHLFLDQDAVPTIVEVKRASDTRIRREVVGQMLDYAANAVVYWPVEAIRSELEAQHEDPQRVFADFLDDVDASAEEYWQRVKTNLQAGKVRMVFVADRIPAELRRIVEFMNQQMDPAEVLAVEIKQYVGENFKTLVPRVIGQTAEAQQKKSAAVRTTSGQWNEGRFFEELQRQAPRAVAPARDILQWAEDRALNVLWGRGKHYGTFSPAFVHREAEHKLVQVWTGDYFYVLLGDLKNRTPFDDELKRRELLRRLNEIPGVSIPDAALGKYPSAPLTALNDEKALRQFLDVLDWIVQEIAAT